jgi:hypothetical protein
MEEDNDKKHERNRLLVILIIIFAIIIVVLGYYSSLEDGSGSIFDRTDREDKTYEQRLEEEKEFKENFEEFKDNVYSAESFIGVDGKFNIKLVNEGSEPFCNAIAYIIFYDAENKIVSIEDEDVDYIEANGVFYISVDPPAEFDRFDYYLKCDYYYSNYIPMTDKVSYEVIEGKYGDDIEIINNSKDFVEYVNIAIIYYDSESKPVYLDSISEYDLKGGAKEKRYISTDVSYIAEGASYDKYEVILENAYTREQRY